MCRVRSRTCSLPELGEAVPILRSPLLGEPEPELEGEPR